MEEVGEVYRDVVEAAASERERAGVPSAKLAEGTGETRELLAELVGMRRTTYEKAHKVVEAAKADPEKYGDLAALTSRSIRCMFVLLSFCLGCQEPSQA